MRAVLILALTSAALAATLAQPAAAQLRTSDQCGSCHRDIYKMWRASKHAQSMEGDAFLESFRHSQRRWGHERSRVCLHCHAPIVMETGDWELREKITWEGVNCDVCHSLVEVDLSGHGPRMLHDYGLVKRGPIRDADSEGHDVAYSALHEQSIVCAPCHQYANADGTPVMSTFTEWQNSGAALEGTTCQDCHMWATKAELVDPRVKRVASAEVNLHEMPGGHSRHQLVKALGIEYELEHTGDSVGAEIFITNTAGHAVPTGMPSKEIILTVAVESAGQETTRYQHTFGKTLVDATGEPIEHTWGFFERGVRVARDTRVPADQTWVQKYEFPVPTDATAYFSIRLRYRNAMVEMQYEATDFEFFSERRTIRPDSQ